MTSEVVDAVERQDLPSRRGDAAYQSAAGPGSRDGTVLDVFRASGAGWDYLCGMSGGETNQGAVAQ